MMSELRRILTQYVNGEIDQYALEDWITANLQSVLDSRDARAIATVNELEALIIRVGESIAEESELRNRVIALLPLKV